MSEKRDSGWAAGDGLARVTFLPGVVPPPASSQPVPSELPQSELPQSESVQSEWQPATPTLPSAARETAEGDVAGRVTDRARDRAADRAEKRAANVSMHALTRRDMSKWELEQTLASRGLDVDQIDDEIQRLEGVGLIDDAALAETIVRVQHDRKGLGRSALVAELRRRHVAPEHIEAALEGLDSDDELDRARELATRRAPQLASLDRATAVRRLSGFLMRKGYSSSIVRTAVDEALAGIGSTVRFR